MKTVLPVIHVESLDQAVRNVTIAQKAGADGVFLINHSMTSEDLLTIAEEVSYRFPGFWLGVNCLDMGPKETFATINNKVNAVWADNAGIDEDKAEQTFAEEVMAVRKAHAPHAMYFGGVAFKYQRQVVDVESAVLAAEKYMDVITTSGVGTGHAADLTKLRRMKTAAPNAKIAVASGITPENVHEYLPYVDYFLVATGISKSFTELDQDKATALVKAVKSWVL